METDSTPRAARGAAALQQLDFSPINPRPVSDFSHQSCNIIYICCIKVLNYQVCGSLLQQPQETNPVGTY